MCMLFLLSFKSLDVIRIVIYYHFFQVRVRPGPGKGASGSTEHTVCRSILLTKGAFCTPRNVIRSITSRKKPAAADVIEEMKKLETNKMGHFLEESRDKVFYKVLPTDGNKELIEDHVDFTEYKECFETEMDSKYLTQAQTSRLLAKSPDRDVLISTYGYK